MFNRRHHYYSSFGRHRYYGGFYDGYRAYGFGSYGYSFRF